MPYLYTEYICKYMREIYDTGLLVHGLTQCMVALVVYSPQSVPNEKAVKVNYIISHHYHVIQAER